MDEQGTPRRKWPRVPVPPGLFDLMIVMARAHGHNEQSLYQFLYEALKQGYPDDFEKLKGYFDLDGFEQD